MAANPSFSIKTKVLALCLGTVMAIALLEVTFAVVGRIENQRRQATENQAARKASLRIACIGNSHTWGTGALPGQSFPDLLRMKMQTEGISSFDVANFGKGNANSTNILDTLPQLISSYQPTVAIVMAGEPNSWNQYGFNRFLASQNKGAFNLHRFSNWLFDTLYELRTFRFLSRLYSLRSTRDASLVFPLLSKRTPKELGFQWIAGLENYNMIQPNRLDERSLAEGVTVLRELIKLQPQHPGLRYYLAQLRFLQPGGLNEALALLRDELLLRPEHFNFLVYRDLTEYLSKTELGNPVYEELLASARKTYPGDSMYTDLKQWFQAEAFPERFQTVNDSPKDSPDIREFIHFLEFATDANPVSPRSYYYLSRIYHKRKMRQEAARVLIEGIAANPLANQFNFVGALMEMEPNLKDRELKISVQALARSFAEDFPSAAYRLEVISDESIEAWVRHDLNEIVTLLQNSGAHVVLQTYPPLRIGGQRNVDNVIREIARNRGLVLSDTEAMMTKKFSTDGDKEIHYTTFYGKTDNHLGAKGYVLLSEILWQTLTTQNLIDLPRRDKQ